MLFNSYEFILFFLPIVLLVFVLIGRFEKKELAVMWLVISSLFFYGWWNPIYLILILGSMVFNYLLGLRLASSPSRMVLTFGVATNLLLLGYYKYTNFIVDNINILTGINWQISHILLPLAISFFTFQQIAYLVDAHRGETQEHNALHYCLFVTFFPQLIAGPIVHHKEMLPQFAKDSVYSLRADNVAIGLTIFSIGLFKKVILADNVALFSTPIFEAAEAGHNISFFEAWGGSLAYTFQLYFDFSGYADMAIGASRLFGIKLPLNFNSPYKSLSIVDFWRRWHMTLSRFLRDYLYIALGGNRKGKSRRYINLMATMVLGGIWHGAGWTFLIWGTLHGVYLVINHSWQNLVKGIHFFQGKIWKFMSWTLTFTSVVVAWVYFRAESVSSANKLVFTMFGGNGIAFPERMSGSIGGLEQTLLKLGFTFDGQLILTIGEWLQGLVLITFLLWIAVFLPNTQQLMKDYEPSVDDVEANRSRLVWQPALLWGVFIASLALVAFIKANDVSEFLYFQF